MRNPFVFCLATTALLAATATSANAQPVAGLTKSASLMVETTQAGLIEVGWKAKRKRTGMRHRTSRRPHGNSRRGFRGDGSRAAILPTIPGIASTLIHRRKCLDALFPGSDPACN
jgi:hypothetical protein